MSDKQDLSVKQKMLDVIREWKHSWARDDYRRHVALGIDSNMKHDLVRRFLESQTPQGVIVLGPPTGSNQAIVPTHQAAEHTPSAEKEDLRIDGNRRSRYGQIMQLYYDGKFAPMESEVSDLLGMIDQLTKERDDYMIALQHYRAIEDESGIANRALARWTK